MRGDPHGDDIAARLEEYRKFDIPKDDESAKVRAARTRQPTPTANGKSPRSEQPSVNGKSHAAGKPTPNRGASKPHIPAGTRDALDDPNISLIITVGKAEAICADQHGFPCVGLFGVWGWQVKRPTDASGRKVGTRELIPDLLHVVWAGRVVVIAYDSDAVAKSEVLWARWYLAEALRDLGATVLVVNLPAEADGEKNGIDDYIVRHGAEKFRSLVAAATAPEPPEVDDPRPTVTISTHEYRTNAEAVNSLAAEPDIYQRGGLLVRVTQSPPDPGERAAVRHEVGAPEVRPLVPALLRERLTRCARWVSIRKREGKSDEQPAHPPDWAVSAIHSRSDWPGIRRLDAVVTHPVLLPDGSILAANGYDPRSGLLVAIPSGVRLSIPGEATRKDVAEARAVIEDVISDFPFKKSEHLAAWFASLLTPLAWFAFEGPAPLFLIDKNVRGAGAGLLADVVALTLTGRRFPVMSYTNDREELRKKITSLAAEGERLVLLDNLAGPVGNDVLDMALTADRWKDRLLGGNKVYDGPLHVCWYATGNNVEIRADSTRRVCPIQMESSEENPELRTGFRYPNLRAHVRANRGPLLSAALTILRGWVTAGRPRHGLPAWGSFEPWSDVVREAVVYAGLPDPGDTRLDFQSAADSDAQTMTAMIAAMERFDPTGQGRTTGDIVEAIRKPHDTAPDWHADLKSAVEELCGKVDTRALGYRLRHFRRRNFRGKMLDHAGTVGHGGAPKWVVVGAKSPSRPVGGDGGHGGDVSPPSAKVERGEL